MSWARNIIVLIYIPINITTIRLSLFEENLNDGDIQLINSFSNYARGKAINVNDENTLDLTDGDLTTLKIYSLSEKKLTITIQADDQILSHMKIYVGDGGPNWKNNNMNNTMDYLDIKCNTSGSNNPDERICGELSTRIYRLKDITKGIRINMKPSKYYSVNLYFPQKIGQQLEIAEIELYVQDNDVMNRVIHLGCFVDFVRTPDTVTENFETFEKCAKLCEEKETMAISKVQQACACGFEIVFDREVEKMNCNTRCSKRRCGSNATYSFYLTKYNFPYFVGCYGLKNIMFPNITIKNITVSKCFLECPNFIFIGVALGKCGCMHHIHEIVESNRWKCMNPCKYDSESMCGGPNGINVYSGCRSPIRYIQCFHVMKCRADIFNHLGVCRKRCLPGYEGEHCIMTAERRTTAIMTGTEIITGTRIMTGTEIITGTRIMTGTGIITGTRIMTGTGIMTGTRIITGTTKIKGTTKITRTEIMTTSKSVIKRASYIRTISSALLALFLFP